MADWNPYDRHVPGDGDDRSTVADIPVPPEAVTAASAVLWGVHGTTPPYLPRVAEYVSVESTGAEREAEMAAFRAAGAESNALNDDLVRRALEAAAPFIAAAERRRIGESSFSPDKDDRTGLFRLARADGVLAERQRICQLADRVEAFYPDPDAPGLTLPFADLIGDPDA